MKKKFSARIIIGMAVALCVLIILPQNSVAQADRSLSFLPIVPHGRNLNPGFVPDYRLYVGIPLFSSIKTGFENTINYEDIFMKKGDSLVLDRDYILSNLDDETRLNFNLFEEYLTFGFKVDKNYFHFRIADIAESNIMLNKGMMTFLLYGNGSTEMLGKNINVGGSEINMTYFREYSFGYTRMINEKFNAGINLKYLQGIANISSKSTDINIYTDPEDFTISASTDIEINLSAPGIGSSKAKAGDFLPNAANGGFAIDLGAQYAINQKYEVWASLLNLGSITWKDNVKNYKTQDPNKTIVYEGFDIGDFFDDNTLDSDGINNILDSISDDFGIKETETKYKNALSPLLNLGGKFNLTEKDMFSILISRQFFDNYNWGNFTLAYTRKFSRDINLMVSNSMFSQSYFNPGIGFAANIGPLQLYLINENIIAPIALNNSNFFTVRFGINLVFESKGSQIAEPPAVE